MGGGGNPNGGGQRNGGQYNGGFGGNIGQLNGPGTLGERRIDGQGADPQSSRETLTPRQAEQAYNDLIRDLGRLRNAMGDDKDLNREYQQTLKQVQQLNPNKWGNNAQLSEVINGQVLTAIDQVELLLRRKLDANDGSVRSASPRNIPPGYANAVAEYNKRLSKQ